MDLGMVFLLCVMIGRTTLPLRLWNQPTYPVTVQVTPSAPKPCAMQVHPPQRTSALRERWAPSVLPVGADWQWGDRMVFPSMCECNVYLKTQYPSTLATLDSLMPLVLSLLLFNFKRLPNFSSMKLKTIGGSSPPVRKVLTHTILWPWGPRSKLYQNRTHKKMGLLLVFIPGLLQQSIISWESRWTVTLGSWRAWRVLWSLNLF